MILNRIATKQQAMFLTLERTMNFIKLKQYVTKIHFHRVNRNGLRVSNDQLYLTDPKAIKVKNPYYKQLLRVSL
jgi:hypothetical protein